MATINYNGMELEEVTTPQIFDPPKKCVVWDDELSPYEEYVLAITAEKRNPVVTYQHVFRQHCALLPDPPKPRRVTNRELARWLAQGNGEFTNPQADFYNNYASFSYEECNKDKEVYANFKVRKWSDTEWHEPDVFYIRLEDVK